MKVRELIDQLQDLEREEGNLEVLIEDFTCKCALLRYVKPQAAHLTQLGEDEENNFHIGISCFDENIS